MNGRASRYPNVFEARCFSVFETGPLSLRRSLTVTSWLTI